MPNPVDDGVGAALNRVHAFWDTQPVPKLHETFADGTDQHGPIDAPKTVDQVRATPIALPDAYEWYDVDMTDETEVEQVYDLLTNNYVEDNDAMFRFGRFLTAAAVHSTDDPNPQSIGSTTPVTSCVGR